MSRSFTVITLFLLWTCCSVSLTDAIENDATLKTAEEECLGTQIDVGIASPPTCSSPSKSKNAVPPDCRLVYAKIPQTDTDNDGEWGVFTMVPRQKGTPVNRYGDIVIQWPDPQPMLKYPSLPSTCQDDDCPPRRGLLKYTWNGQETGGHDEGRKQVESVVTGLGMCARKIVQHHNILPLVPRVDEGGLTRFDSPGAGAITQYHNYTWWLSKDVEAGEELLYSGKLGSFHADETPTQNSVIPSKPSLDYLKEHGYCIDTLRPRKSRVKEAGRGAFAMRDVPEGSIIAPVPVVPIKREDLMGRDSKRKSKEQLLLNYCFGSNTSEWLLFPYSPVVNLINHFHEPNVKLQWSSESLEKIRQSKGSHFTVNDGNTLLLEMVATKPIHEGEEIYLDYGRAWEDAWWNHTTQDWKPNTQHYTPSYVMDDAIRMLRTEQEQKEHPYPSNVFTSCFYRYSDRTEEERTKAEQTNQKDSSSLNSFRWQLTKGLYDLRNLRPCNVLKRLEDSKGRSAYAVRMLNRPGLDEKELIPKDELHIVTHVPRAAIRFSDKAGTTDQHLPGAFRHEIGFPEISLLEESEDIMRLE
jgi:SET domain